MNKTTKRSPSRLLQWSKQLSALVLTGSLTMSCAQHQQPVWVVSSHTVRVKPDQDVDTVWLIVDGTLMRCSGGTTPPSCAKVQELR